MWIFPENPPPPLPPLPTPPPLSQKKSILWIILHFLYSKLNLTIVQIEPIMRCVFIKLKKSLQSHCRKNVGYASTCNAVGQTAGFFLGNVVYLTLDSPDFANRFFRSEPQPYGLVSLSGFISLIFSIDNPGSGWYRLGRSIKLNEVVLCSCNLISLLSA